jgi:hypothetical protein
MHDEFMLVEHNQHYSLEPMPLSREATFLMRAEICDNDIEQKPSQ